MVAESRPGYPIGGVESQPIGDKKGGVIWHTQGSGKSLSMVFYTGKIVLAMDNPTILVITDRNELHNLRTILPVFAQELASARRQTVRLRADNARLLEQVRRLQRQHVSRDGSHAFGGHRSAGAKGTTKLA